jgi:hypothetical protein
VMTLHPATFGIGNAAATSLHSNQIAKASSLPAPTTLIVQKGSALPTPPPGMAILWQDQHFPHVIRIPLGAGSIIWGSSASVIDNDFLRRADNLPWFLSLLRNGDKMPERIWFEEAHHGYRKNYALADLLKDPGLRLAAIQAAMGLLLFLTSQLTRFGSTIPLESDSGRSGMEFVEWMAQLYRNADLRNEIVQTLFEETRARIQHKFNLPPRASDEILDQRLRDAFPQLPSWKKISRQFQLFYAAELRLPPAGWLKISRDLIHIKREMI